MEATETATPQWRPLNRKERRVLGVLVEKAKTTPEQYPLSLNALTSGCNQKSNRDPKMEIDGDDVEEALESLRMSGAVAEVHGGGRVIRYRHHMKDWLGVDGVELAVMAELLLRGSQSVGDLRGRAARMASGQLADMGVLRPILASLAEKKLLVPLSPDGRGQVVTHGLYSVDELAHERKKHGSSGGETISKSAHSESSESGPAAEPSVPTHSLQIPSTPQPRVAASQTDTSHDSVHDDLRAEVASLRAEVARLRKEVEDLWESLGS